MMPANAPLYSVPHSPQPSSPYLGPGAFPLADLQSYTGHAPRHALSQTLSQSQMLPSISASPPSSFQISPPLHPHQQLSLHQSSLLNQPIRMQQVQSQPIISHQMGLQASLHSPPPGQQVDQPYLHDNVCHNIYITYVTLSLPCERLKLLGHIDTVHQANKHHVSLFVG